MPGRTRVPARPTALALAALLLAAAACGPSDPLEKVRRLQDTSGDYAATVEPLRELLKARPDDPEVHFRYGQALLATGEQGLAMWPLKRAMESPEWVQRAGLPLAATLLSSGAHDDAIEVCDQILEEAPDDVPALLLRANARMHSRRDYEGTLADAERVLELDPGNQQALVPRTVALLGLERVEEAAEALEDLEATYRDDSLGLEGSSGLCAARATFALEKGELELAQERYEGCVDAFPTDGVALNAAIRFFDSQGQGERSDQILAEALALAPDSYSFRSTLALRLDAQGRRDEAEALLREGTELDSPIAAADAWAGLASYNVDRGDFEEAVVAFEKARALAPNPSPHILLAHADALVLARRFDEAEALVAEMGSASHQALLRGRIALMKGDPAAALEAFDEGVALWPNNAVARYYAAVAAERLGDFDRAIEDYRYAMRIDSNATDAHLRLARLHEAAGRHEAVLSTLSFKAGARPEEDAAARLHLRSLARLGRLGQVPTYVQQQLRRPDRWGGAVAAIGEGVRARSGPEAALEAMREAGGLDLLDPAQVEALAAIAGDLAATGRREEALALVDASLAKHPEAAAFHAVRGDVLAATGAAPAAARGAYERALALDAEESRALRGLARLTREAGDREAALGLFERAVEREPGARAAVREAAALEAALGRTAEAEARLAALLEDHPYDAEAARALAELRAARCARDARTLELARRAVAFGGGAEAEAFLDRLGAQKG